MNDSQAASQQPKLVELIERLSYILGQLNEHQRYNEMKIGEILSTPERLSPPDDGRKIDNPIDIIGKFSLLIGKLESLDNDICTLNRKLESIV